MNTRTLEARMLLFAAALGVLVLAPPLTSQELENLTVKEIMEQLIVPATAAIWGAFEVRTDSQWLELETAARQVVQAGELLARGGSAATDQAIAANPDWQEFTQQMILAGRGALAAIAERNEQTLSGVGNDLLYPPCESCHGVYMGSQ